MVRGITKMLIGLGMATTMIGCVQSPQFVERVPVAAPDSDARRGYDRPKPMPDQPRFFDRDPRTVPPQAPEPERK
jgi:hypothetical protein